MTSVLIMTLALISDTGVGIDVKSSNRDARNGGANTGGVNTGSINYDIDVNCDTSVRSRCSMTLRET
jgi:hypothetical protein